MLVLATVPVVAAMTVALSASRSTTPAQTTSPSITDLFCSSTSITLSTDCVYCSMNSPVAPAATASMLSWASR